MTPPAAGMVLPLRGMGVLVTRPAHQAGGLCRLIEARGGVAIPFPTLEILEPRDPAAMLTVIGRLRDYDMAIFTSPNAAARGMPHIQASGGVPPHLQLAAIGRGTARELERRAGRVDLAPDGPYHSEALLALPAMRTVAGRRIAIFRGEGGRELLGDVLRARGAAVAYAEVYRRAAPAVDPGGLIECWRRGELHAVVVTSTEGLCNLFDIVGEPGQQWLRDTPLIVVSTRARTLARELGFSHPARLAREASDEAIVEALVEMAPNPTRVTLEDPQ